MRGSLNRRLYRIFLSIRHPEIVLARWRGRSLEPLDAVCVECAGPAGADSAPPPLMDRAVFRLAARKTFPYARGVVFTGRSDPLLHEELREMILAARSYGKEARVISDGVLLDEGTICALIAAGTDHLTVSPAAPGTPASDRAAFNIGVLRKVMDEMEVPRPALELVPPGAETIPARRIDIAWDGTVYLGGALRGAEAPEPIGNIGELRHRAILSSLSPSPQRGR
jgi:hypothetical protein